MKESEIILKTKWDNYNTTLLTSKLYRHVEKRHIEFTLNAKKGSLDTEFFIKLFEIELHILIDLFIIYLNKRVNKEREKKNELKPPILINVIDNRKYIITGKGNNEFS